MEAAFYAGDRSSFVGGPLSRETAWRGFAASCGHWMLRGYGFWALEEKTTGAYLGRVGLWFPEGLPEPEIGWALSGENAQGRGFVREAAIAARRHAYGALGWTTAISLIDSANTRSIKLAERLGARLEHETFGALHVYRHPSPVELEAAA